MKIKRKKQQCSYQIKWALKKKDHYRDSKEHYIIIKGLIQEEDIAIICIYVSIYLSIYYILYILYICM